MTPQFPRALFVLPVLILVHALTSEVRAGTGILVTTLSDNILNDGQCSLREAIINANNNDQSGSPDCASGSLLPDEIYFDTTLNGQTLVLSGGALPIVTSGLAVIGPEIGNPESLVIDAGHQSRMFHAQGSSPSEFTLVLSGLSLVNGQTIGTQQPGGAVFADQADLWLDGVEVRASRTVGFQSFGGGVAVRDGNLELNSSRILDNQTSANSAGGGGVSVTGNLLMNHSTVSANSTQGDQARGGGMVVGGNALIQTSTISDNSTSGSAAHGGGLAVVSGDLDLINATVSGNQIIGTSSEGGGIHAATGEVVLRHATLAFNQADAGGVDGLWRGGSAPANPLVVQNSLIFQDRDGAVGCSSLADGHVGSLATDASCTGSATLAVDIGLQPLADNGGPTATHAFSVPSAALNSAADCEAAFGIIDDQRGQPRPGRGSTACDIGAWEYQAPFCVTNAQELQNALNVADSNGIDDLIKVAAGIYPAPSGGFHYTAGGPTADNRSLEIVGGWVAQGNNPCGQMGNPSPFNTILDGEEQTRVFGAVIRDQARLSIRQIAFVNGQAGSDPGGGLAVSLGSGLFDGEIVIERTAFVGNQAGWGGGLWMDLNPVTAPARVRVANSHFQGNQAIETAGAVYLTMYSDSDLAGLHFINNTAIDNVLSAGIPGQPGGVRLGGSTLGLHVVANNNLWANSQADLLLTPPESTELLHNNIGVFGNTFPPLVSIGNLSVEPVYLDCPGCTLPIPAAESALINAGLVPVPPSDWQPGERDVMGRPRIVDGGIEIGAFENDDSVFADRFQ